MEDQALLGERENVSDDTSKDLLIQVWDESEGLRVHHLIRTLCTNNKHPSLFIFMNLLDNKILNDEEALEFFFSLEQSKELEILKCDSLKYIKLWNSILLLDLKERIMKDRMIKEKRELSERSYLESFKKVKDLLDKEPGSGEESDFISDDDYKDNSKAKT